MIKLIKKVEKQKVQFNIGDQVKYFDVYERIIYKGVVVKVHKLNLDFQDEKGNVYRASIDEVTK